MEWAGCKASCTGPRAPATRSGAAAAKRAGEVGRSPRAPRKAPASRAVAARQRPRALAAPARRLQRRPVVDLEPVARRVGEVDRVVTRAVRHVLRPAHAP